MVLLDSNGQLMDGLVFDKATLPDVAQGLKKWAPIMTLVEHVHAMPGQGVVSMFSFGRVFGEVLGILAALQLPHQLVHPRVWSRVMHQGVTGDEAKARSLLAAARLFPGVDLRASDRCKKPHAGLVDAILLAEYGRRLFLTSSSQKLEALKYALASAR